MRRMTKKGLVLILMLMLIAVVFTAIPVNVSAAPGIIWIKADGTVDPSTAPISVSGTTYTLTADITDSVYIYKGGVTFDGDTHTITGTLTGFGVYVYNVDDVVVQDVTVSSMYYGIFISNSDVSTVQRCAVKDSLYDGIKIMSSNKNLVAKNYLEGNHVSISLDDSDECAVYQNKAENNIAGVSINGDSNHIYQNYLINNNNGINSYMAQYNLVEDNVLNNNLYTAIHMHTTSNNIIKENEASYCTTGIYLYNSQSNEICCNEFSYNDNGIYVIDSYNNILHHNNIISNTNQYYKPGWAGGTNQFDDGAGEGNYWSDYPGVDTTGDGVGDTRVPHPDTDMGNGYFKLDNYPLVEPWSGVPTIEEVIEDIEEMALPAGLENSLSSKLENAQKSIDNGNINAAINQLNAFINQVEAQRGKKLTDDQADALIEAAQAIIDDLSS